jgi:choline-sulfatase
VTATDRPPDIVLVLTDQQRADQVGFVQPDQFDTPNLDALAARGVIFDRAYSSSTTCVPSRVSILTGFMPHRCPVALNGLAVLDGFWTVARELRRHGYQTAYVGKMHMWPMHAEHGFDVRRLCEHTGVLGGYADEEHDHYHDWLVQQGVGDWRLERPRDVDIRSWQPHIGPSPFPYDHEVHPTGWIEREAREVLATRDPDRPLLLVVSFLHPHAPFNPPEPYASMYDPADAVLPADGFEQNERLPDALRTVFEGAAGPALQVRADDEATTRNVITSIRALVKQIDDSLGRVLEAVDLDRSVVVYSSDHGDYSGHRGMLFKAPWVPVDDLVRVPLVVAGAGVASGRRVERPVQTADFPLTCLELAGIAPPTDEFVSESLVPHLAAEPVSTPDRTLPLCTQSRWPALVHGSLKLIGDNVTGADVLFDLAADPGETIDVVADPAHRAAVDELRDRRQDWMQYLFPYVDWFF